MREGKKRGRLLVVSNRLPVSVVRRDGRIHYESSSGGLATALSSLGGFARQVWTGWSGLLHHLSEMAGAAEELGEALVVNPNDKDEVAGAIRAALEMDRGDQARRITAMQARLRRYDVHRWAGDFVDRLEAAVSVRRQMAASRMTAAARREIGRQYAGAGQRLLLLDYDGTLVRFREDPGMAAPDRGLAALLARLGGDPRSRVVIVSGRDRATLDRWLGGLPVDMVAEHGVWTRERGGEWRTPGPLRTDWMGEIRPIMEHFADRTPGAFVEEKERSLVWHFRRSDPALALLRASEMKDAVRRLAGSLGLDVVDGNRVVEIKTAGITKGRAATGWIEGGAPWDFILAAGDDATDEDLFAALPAQAWTIKVGMSPSRARVNVESCRELRALLGRLAGAASAGGSPSRKGGRAGARGAQGAGHA